MAEEINKINPVTTYILGDCTGDRQVTMEDAEYINGIVTGIHPKPVEGSLQFLRCDVDQDGEITAIDGSYIGRWLAGIDDGYPWYSMIGKELVYEGVVNLPPAITDTDPLTPTPVDPAAGQCRCRISDNFSELDDYYSQYCEPTNNTCSRGYVPSCKKVCLPINQQLSPQSCNEDRDCPTPLLGDPNIICTDGCCVEDSGDGGVEPPPTRNQRDEVYGCTCQCVPIEDPDQIADCVYNGEGYFCREFEELYCRECVGDMMSSETTNCCNVCNCEDPPEPPNILMGCTDQNACNYTPEATEDDGTCITDNCCRCDEIPCELIAGSGDMDNDGAVNIQDIIIIVNFVLGTTEFNSCETAAADYNQDGLVDILDLIAMVGIILETFATSASSNILESNYNIKEAKEYKALEEVFKILTNTSKVGAIDKNLIKDIWLNPVDRNRALNKVKQLLNPFKRNPSLNVEISGEYISPPTRTDCTMVVNYCTTSVVPNFLCGVGPDGACSCTCLNDIYGCMDDQACNFNPEASVGDGSCEYCTPDTPCYDTNGTETTYECLCPGEQCPDGYSIYPDDGCIYENACNYDDNAEVDSGNCEFPADGYNCSGDPICDQCDPGYNTWLFSFVMGQEDPIEIDGQQIPNLDAYLQHLLTASNYNWTQFQILFGCMNDATPPNFCTPNVGLCSDDSGTCYSDGDCPDGTCIWQSFLDELVHNNDFIDAYFGDTYCTNNCCTAGCCEAPQNCCSSDCCNSPNTCCASTCACVGGTECGMSTYTYCTTNNGYYQTCDEIAGCQTNSSCDGWCYGDGTSCTDCPTTTDTDFASCTDFMITAECGVGDNGQWCNGGSCHDCPNDDATAQTNFITQCGDDWMLSGLCNEDHVCGTTSSCCPDGQCNNYTNNCNGDCYCVDIGTDYFCEDDSTIWDESTCGGFCTSCIQGTACYSTFSDGCTSWTDYNGFYTAEECGAFCDPSSDDFNFLNTFLGGTSYTDGYGCVWAELDDWFMGSGNLTGTCDNGNGDCTAGGIECGAGNCVIDCASGSEISLLTQMNNPSSNFGTSVVNSSSLLYDVAVEVVETACTEDWCEGTHNLRPTFDLPTLDLVGGYNPTSSPNSGKNYISFPMIPEFKQYIDTPTEECNIATILPASIVFTVGDSISTVFPTPGGAVFISSNAYVDSNGDMAITNPGAVWDSFVSGAGLIVKMHNPATINWTLPEGC